MGVPKLKKKIELNYRRGGTSRSCRYCNHFVSWFPDGADVEGPVVIASRCKVMGLEHGRLYRITPNHICDRYDGSNYLKRLKEGTSFQE